MDIPTLIFLPKKQNNLKSQVFKVHILGKQSQIAFLTVCSIL